MKLRKIITASRQRTAYRYAVIFIVLTPMLVMRFVDDLPFYAGRYVNNTSLVLIAAMALLPPPGGFLSLFERDGDHS